MMMMMLVCNGGVTYFIDLEPNRVGPHDVSYALTPHDVRYALTCDFDLESQLRPLADLDAIHSDHEVRGAYSFEVEAKATAHGDGARSGVIVWPARGVSITAPLPKPKRRTETAHGEEGD